MRDKLFWLTIGASPALWLWLGQQPADWSGWTPDPCRTLDCYGEPIGAGFISQPLASYSNLAFLAAAGGLAVAERRASGLALALVGTAWGSLFYHASLTRVGEWFDLMGTYLPLTVLVMRHAQRSGVLTTTGAARVGAAVIGAGALQMIVAREAQQVVFGVLAAALVAVDLVARRRAVAARPGPWWRAAIGALAFGAAIWLADGQGWLPRPAAGSAPWHALWHTCAALAVYCAGRDAAGWET
jgi:hypothetical protein